LKRALRERIERDPDEVIDRLLASRNAVGLERVVSWAFDGVPDDDDAELERQRLDVHGGRTLAGARVTSLADVVELAAQTSQGHLIGLDRLHDAALLVPLLEELGIAAVVEGEVPGAVAAETA
jgi:hypothetical protein